MNMNIYPSIVSVCTLCALALATRAHKTEYFDDVHNIYKIHVYRLAMLDRYEHCAFVVVVVAAAFLSLTYDIIFGFKQYVRVCCLCLAYSTL